MCLAPRVLYTVHMHSTHALYWGGPIVHSQPIYSCDVLDAADATGRWCQSCVPWGSALVSGAVKAHREGGVISPHVHVRILVKRPVCRDAAWRSESAVTFNVPWGAWVGPTGGGPHAAALPTLGGGAGAGVGPLSALLHGRVEGFNVYGDLPNAFLDVLQLSRHHKYITVQRFQGIF
jgi:hypothetical protein